jgi:hypothetical protein
LGDTQKWGVQGSCHGQGGLRKGVDSFLHWRHRGLQQMARTLSGQSEGLTDQSVRPQNGKATYFICYVLRKQLTDQLNCRNHYNILNPNERDG